MSRDENAHGTYIGTDWRTALYRNVTVSLEFAEYDLRPESMNAERARQLVKEAFRECQRLLATPEAARGSVVLAVDPSRSTPNKAKP